MRLLLDTHVLLSLLDKEGGTSQFAAIFENPDKATWISVVSIWEIAIKTRLGKLDPAVPVSEIPSFAQSSGVGVLTVQAAHVILNVMPEPQTRDPFDRLLLAQCDVENMLLVTQDRALRDHPLAYKG